MKYIAGLNVFSMLIMQCFVEGLIGNGRKHQFFPRMTHNFASTRPVTTTSLSQHVLALDFDGVVCDSAQETGSSAILAAKAMWREEIKLEAEEDFQRIRAMIRQVRPIIETGYENMLLCRYFSESYNKQDEKTKPQSDWQQSAVQYILSHWNAKMRDELLALYKADKDIMIKSFGTTRDNLIANDLNQWCSLNSLYPHIATSFSTNEIDLSRLFIVTTKQERFVRAILQYHQMPIISNIFDLENPFGPKSAVLQELSKRNPKSTIHFVEDRYETLLHIKQLQKSNTPYLENVKLYLVDWGYNQAHHRQAVKESDDVVLLTPTDFQALVQSTVGQKKSI